jgi:O-antigen ligase
MASPLLLALAAFLPFREFLITWFPWFPVALLIGIATAAALALLGRESARMHLSLPACLLAVWIGFEVFRSPELDRGVGLVETWGAALLLGVAARSVSRRDGGFAVKMCVVLWVVASLIAALNPMWQTPASEMEQLLKTEVLEEEYKQAILHAASQSRFHFPFGNPIDLGLFLSLVLFVFPALWQVCRERAPGLIPKTALGISAGIQVYILWGTKSRTPLIGFFCGLLVWLVGRGWMGKRLVGLAAAVLVGGAALLLVSPGGREMLARTETVHARVLYWRAALRMAHDRPLLGTGIGGYGLLYPQYRELTPHQTLYPHNLFLEAMTDTGAIGLCLLLWVLMRHLSAPSGKGRRGEVSSPSPPASASWKGEETSAGCTEGGETPPLQQEINLWVSASVTAFFVATLMGFHQNMLYIAGVIALIAGLFVPGEVPARRGDIVLEGGKARWMALGFLFVFAVPCVLRELGHFHFDRAKVAFESERDPLKAAAELKLASQVWPPLADAHSYLGGLAQEFGDDREAETYLRRAIAWAPLTPHLHQALAELLWKTNRQQEALAELDQAAGLHPVKWDYHEQRSRWLYELGQTAAASKEREQAQFLKAYEPRYEEARKAAEAEHRTAP